MIEAQVSRSKVEGNVVVSVRCVSCKNDFVFDVPFKDWQDFFAGKHVQRALPYLDRGKRELLISGYCSECWDKLFPEEEE